MIGKPSAALAAKIDTDEKTRIAKRKEELGEEKLKELEKRMQDAKKESEVEPPAEMISGFPITDVSDDVASLRDTHKPALELDVGTCRDRCCQSVRTGREERQRSGAGPCGQRGHRPAVPSSFRAREGPSG